ncbi:MAG: TIGR03885 family FMN-dependent LLM class oxidoreductase [Nitrospirota bacterium]
MSGVKIGFHASHEQFKPGRLLELARMAEAAGFAAAMCSDHFYPWNPRQGESGFAWSWLGAALQATSLPFGVVCAPGQRYHPAIIAQAAATLAEMFPDRFWVAIGSGQLLNEAITGDRWPPKAERNERLLECAGIMRALWAGETVTHYGLVAVEEAKLYTRPPNPPLLIGAAITPETAAWVGGWADGLITVSKPGDELNKVIEAFRNGGGEGKPMFLQMQISYAATEEEALHGAWDQWRSTILDSAAHTELRSPEIMDAAAQFVTPEDMHGHVQISSDISRHREWLQEYLDLGFDHLYVHNVNRDQERFIEEFGTHVLPALSGSGATA